MKDIFTLLHIFRAAQYVKQRDNQLDDFRLDGWSITDTVSKMNENQTLTGRKEQRRNRKTRTSPP